MSREDPSYERRAEEIRSDVNVGELTEEGTLSEVENAVMPAQELAVATTDLGADRTKMVDDFLVQCNRESAVGFKVIRKHIWLAASHAQARQFQYWQARSDKTTDEDERTFRRILCMSASEFIALLKNKAIIPPRP